MPKPPERIAVVGWGSLSPLGDDADSSWAAVCARQSGIQTIQEPWAEDLNVRIAGRVAETAFADLEPLLRRRADRCAQLALLAGRQAWAMAEHNRRGLDPTRIAVVLGTGIGGLATMHEQHSQLSEGGPSRVNPLTVPMLIPDAAAGQVAIDLGLQGGAHTPVSACASGAEALMLAQWLLQDDRADLVLAGGSEAPVNRLGLVGFSAMRALSLRNEAPEQASRPYGQTRDGFVLSEGAGVLALMRQSDVPAGDALGWLRAANPHARTKAPAAAFVAQLLAATGVDPYAFLLEADFATMRHADEATYASRLWQWDPAEEDARAAAQKKIKALEQQLESEHEEVQTEVSVCAGEGESARERV